MASILFQQESYKRGMVLGLTMAEIVLLVLFTLLLVLTALLKDKEREHARLAAQMALVEKEISKFTSDKIPNPNELFQELVLAKKRAAEADRLEMQLQETKKEKETLAATLAKERDAHGNRPDQEHKWPPIINLSEAGGYFFEVGSAELTDEFKAALVDKVGPKILQIAAAYPDVDIIEVVGHTDEQIIRRRTSNLDSTLIDVIRTGNVTSLIPADNAGLGIARAAAVVTRLLQDSRLENRFSRILPLSGAQVIQVDETLSQGAVGDVRERRRIEIRLRKYERAGPDNVVRGASSR